MARVTTITNSYKMAKVVDTILNSNVLFSRVVSAAKKWRGEKLQKTVKVSKNTNGGSFDGFDTFSTSAMDNRITLEFPAKFYEKGITLPLTEIAKNQADPNRIADLMDIELEGAAQDMADDLGTIFYLDGTGNSSKDPLGLGAIVDNGDSVGTYGTQSRSTYTTLKSTVTASGGTLSIAKMGTLWAAISSGSIKPTMWLCNETVWNLYEQLLQPQEQIYKTEPMMRNGLIGGTGFTALYYKGEPVIADEKATAQTLFALNEDFLEWTALPIPKTNPVKYRMVIEGNDYTEVEGLGFSWSDWIIPSNQAAVISHMYLGGEFWSSNPKRHGRLTGITSV